MQRRASDDRGAVLIFLAIALVGLIALAGLVLDGGRAYGERRQMQNAADAASMAATRQLDRYVTDQSSDARTILAAARDTAEKNGAERASVTCRLVRFDRSVIGPCPTGATMPQATKDAAAGVVVTTDADPGHVLHAGRRQHDLHRGGERHGPDRSRRWELRRPVPRVRHRTGPRAADPPARRDLPDRVHGERRSRSARSTASTATTSRTTAATAATRPRASAATSTRAAPTPSRASGTPTTGNKNGPTLRLVNSGNVCNTGLRRRLRGGAAAVPAGQRPRRQQLSAPTASTWGCSRSPTWPTTTSTRSSAAAPPSTRAGSWDRPIPTAPASSS